MYVSYHHPCRLLVNVYFGSTSVYNFYCMCSVGLGFREIYHARRVDRDARRETARSVRPSASTTSSSHTERRRTSGERARARSRLPVVPAVTISIGAGPGWNARAFGFARLGSVGSVGLVVSSVKRRKTRSRCASSSSPGRTAGWGRRR